MWIVLTEEEYAELKQRAADWDKKAASERAKLAQSLRSTLMERWGHFDNRIHAILRDWEAGLINR